MKNIQVFKCSIEENEMFSFQNPYLHTKTKIFDFTSFKNRDYVLAIMGNRTFNCLIISATKGNSYFWVITLAVLNEVYQ